MSVVPLVPLEYAAIISPVPYHHAGLIIGRKESLLEDDPQ
jgi:hypothetical protein